MKTLALVVLMALVGGAEAQDFGALKEKAQGFAEGKETIAGMDRAGLEAKLKELQEKRKKSKDPNEKSALDAQIAEIKKKLADLKKK